MSNDSCGIFLFDPNGPEKIARKALKMHVHQTAYNAIEKLCIAECDGGLCVAIHNMIALILIFHSEIFFVFFASPKANA